MQIGVIGLLVTCLAQAAYWVIEEAAHSAAVRAALASEYASGIPVAEALLRRGASREEVLGLLPRLEFDGDRPRVIPAELTTLDAARRKRLRRYGAEGTFFLAALLASVGIVAQALRQRGELMRRQDNFVAAVGHEFKSPLASLRLAAETLELRDLDSEARGRLTSRMLEDLARLEVMVSNTLDAGRLAEGALVLNPRPVVLAPEVEALVAREDCRAHLHHAQVTCEVPPDLQVHVDPVALQTVLRNLLTNAIKSVKAEGSGSVHLCARRDGDEVRLDVTDDGGGFEPSEGERLFEKFYRTGDELTRRTRGSGLGLFITRRYVEASRGRIEAHSEGLGRGARFTVWLPLGQERLA